MTSSLPLTRYQLSSRRNVLKRRARIEALRDPALTAETIHKGDLLLVLFNNRVERARLFSWDRVRVHVDLIDADRRVKLQPANVLKRGEL